MLRPGDPAPDIEVCDDGGRAWRLGDQRGHPVVLVFHRHFY